MMKILSFIFVLTCSSLLMAKEEYDVIALTETHAWVSDLSDSGYVVGYFPKYDVDLESSDPALAGNGFLYHPEQGVKVIEGMYPNKVNDCGFVAGEKDRNVFTFDGVLEKHPEGDVLGLTADNQVLVRNRYSVPATGYLYNSKTKAYIHFDYSNLPCAINQQGEMLYFQNCNDGPVFYEQLLLAYDDNLCICHPILSDSGYIGGILAKGRRQGLFVWNQEKGFQAQIIDQKYEISRKAMNNHGHLVGSLEDLNFMRTAFIYIPNKGLKLFKNCEAYSINDQSQVVGMMTAGDEFAFIWDAKHGMRALNDLIPKDSGWDLVTAKKINNQGYIIGSGYLNGQQRPFLLIPKNL